MKCLASFQDLYVGLEPYRNNKQFGGGVIKKTAPAVFSLLAALELHPDNKRSGVFAPIGGFRAVSQAFLSLAKENGVKIEFNAAVTGVSDTGVYCKKAHSSDKSPETKGSVEDTFVEADLVIINADVPYAAKSLISSSDAPVKTKLTEKIDWDDSYDYSSGVIAFHWSVDKRLDGLNTHNVFLSAKNRSDAEQSWNALRRDAKQRPIKDQAFSFENMDPFNFYVHRAPQTDPTASPDDCDSIMVLVPTDVLVREDANAKLPKAIAIEKYKAQFSDDFIDTVKKSVLTRLSVIESLAGLKNHILDEVVDTPASYADMYNLGAGATFGLSHGFGQLSLTRPSAAFFEKSHKNIMCVGASSRPGNGVPLVLIGAKSVAQMAIERLK